MCLGRCVGSDCRGLWVDDEPISVLCNTARAPSCSESVSLTTKIASSFDAPFEAAGLPIAPLPFGRGLLGPAS